MSAIEKDIRNYISDVGKNLVCSRKQKNQILKDIENDVLDYTDNKQITDINEIYAHFGTPEDLAKTFLSSADVKSVKRKIKTRNIVLAFTVVVLTVFAVFIGYVIADQHDASGHFFADSPIEVLSVSYEDESILYRTEENT